MGVGGVFICQTQLTLAQQEMTLISQFQSTKENTCETCSGTQHPIFPRYQSQGRGQFWIPKLHKLQGLHFPLEGRNEAPTGCADVKCNKDQRLPVSPYPPGLTKKGGARPCTKPSRTKELFWIRCFTNQEAREAIVELKRCVEGILGVRTHKWWLQSIYRTGQRAEVC